MATDSNNPIYPASDLDRAETILGFLGSFWGTTYQGMNQVVSLIEGKAALAQQTYLDILELVASTSRFEVPIFHTDNWYLLTLKESELNSGTSSLPKYDGTYTYGVGGIKYDTPVDQVGFLWDLEVPLKRAPLMLNRITEASLTLTEGADYVIEEDAVRFRVNPFDNELVPKRDIINNDGEIEDREIGLWVFRGDFDYENVYTQFGYVLDLELESSETYRNLINAVMDALVEGSALRHLEEFFSAITGVPLVQEAEETVEQVISEYDRNLVITSANVYKFAAGATIEVAVGDVLQRGDTMSDGLKFYDMQRGATPDEDQVPAITTGRGILAEGYFGDLTWLNEDTALNYTTDDDGRVRLDWDLGGWPGDVEQFFDQMHAKGVADGTTLANLLDPRTDPPGDPLPGTLPSTINPVQFLAENVLRNNGIVVSIKMDQGFDGVGLKAVRLLRKIVPPHVVLILLVTVPYEDNGITMEGAGSETEPGYEEEVVSFDGGTTEDSIDPATYIGSERVTVRNINGRCY